MMAQRLGHSRCRDSDGRGCASPPASRWRAGRLEIGPHRPEIKLKVEVQGLTSDAFWFAI